MRSRRPHGTTISAFCSLSLRPPLVLIALQRDSDLLRLVRSTRRFGVNVLAETQEGLALCFARKGGDKFAAVDWSEDHGLPRLEGTCGWMVCRVNRVMSGGDHMIVVGGVAHAELEPVSPLLYHRRAFGALAGAQPG